MGKTKKRLSFQKRVFLTIKREVDSANASPYTGRRRVVVLHGISNPREHFIGMHKKKGDVEGLKASGDTDRLRYAVSPRVVSNP